jgi:hypothetical protein
MACLLRNFQPGIEALLANVTVLMSVSQERAFLSVAELAGHGVFLFFRYFGFQVLENLIYQFLGWHVVSLAPLVPTLL